MSAREERGLTVLQPGGLVAGRAPLTEAEWAYRKDLFSRLIVRGGDPAQVDLAILICRRYGFDPLLRHVLLIKNNLYVTRDGLRHLANQHPQFDGYSRPEFAQDERGLWIATIAVHRKDRGHPFWATAYQAESQQAGSPVWQSHPRLMTLKVAEVMALRMAFGVSLGTAEELGYDGVAPVSSIGRVTVLEVDDGDEGAAGRVAAQLPARATSAAADLTPEEQATKILDWLGRAARSLPDQRKWLATLFALTDDQGTLDAYRAAATPLADQDPLDEAWHDRMGELYPAQGPAAEDGGEVPF